MHQIRQSAYDNFILSTVSSTGNFTIMTRDPSDLDTRATVAITGYSSANEYQVVSRVFENQIVSTLLSSAGVFLYQLDYTSAVIAAYTAAGNGLGVGGTGTGSGIFSDYKSKKLDKYLNIVCLGDSNTVGSSGESVNPGIENMYPSVLAKQFLYSGVSVINGGVAGDGSSDVQARLATDFNVKKVTNATNVCILMVGANDLRDGDTTEQAWTKLGSLIDAILAQSWDDLWVVTYPPCVDGPTAGLNALIISNASTKGYNVLDVYPYFDDPAHPGRGLDEYYYTSDYVHLNAAGQAYLASLVVDGIFPFYSDSYTYDETLSGEIRSGTLTNHELYKITATEENHFGTGLEVDDYFTSDGTETVDASNKVKQVLTPSTDGVTLQASKWDTTESFGTKASGFKYNEASYAVRVYKVRG
jgi:lysophospholipase L1-like esterase